MESTIIKEKPVSKLVALWEVLLVSTKLGLTSFGGPIAHLGYFHNEYIRKRKWMDEGNYANLVALSQFLPGPASSQVGIGIGIVRAGLLGGLTAWLGFTLPSVIILVLFAILMNGMDVSQSGWIHGLKIVAVAIVGQAVLSMGQKLAAGKIRATLAIVAVVICLLWQTAFSQVVIIAVAAIAGFTLFPKPAVQEVPNLQIRISRTVAIICLVLFALLLVVLPILSQLVPNEYVALFDSFYRSGALVFGGGHVVLPLLEQEMVPTGLVSKADFLAGYGATQAMPGPLFTFAAYLGAIAKGIPGAIVATVAIFLPAFLLIVGALPFWNMLCKNGHIQGALLGVNAAVVGILLAALYNPLWTSAVTSPADFGLAAILFLLLVFWKLPPWVIVAAGMLGGLLVTWCNL